MTGVITTFNIGWFSDIIEGALDLSKSKVIVERNFEQVIGLVRGNEVSAVCIIVSANGWNIGRAIQELHKINPELPILIWGIPSKRGKIMNKSTIYLSPEDYEDPEQRHKITAMFFDGTLKDSHIPCRVTKGSDNGTRLMNWC